MRSLCYFTISAGMILRLIGHIRPLGRVSEDRRESRSTPNSLCHRWRKSTRKPAPKTSRGECIGAFSRINSRLWHKICTTFASCWLRRLSLGAVPRSGNNPDPSCGGVIDLIRRKQARVLTTTTTRPLPHCLSCGPLRRPCFLQRGWKRSCDGCLVTKGRPWSLPGYGASLRHTIGRTCS